MNNSKYLDSVLVLVDGINSGKSCILGMRGVNTDFVSGVKSRDMCVAQKITFAIGSAVVIAIQPGELF